jgi:hypothetical protein
MQNKSEYRIDLFKINAPVHCTNKPDSLLREHDHNIVHVPSYHLLSYCGHRIRTGLLGNVSPSSWAMLINWPVKHLFPCEMKTGNTIVVIC